MSQSAKNLARLASALLAVMLAAGALRSKAYAQPEPPQPQLLLRAPDTRDFPLIRASFQISGIAENPSGWIDTEAVRIIENGTPIAPDDVRVDYTGLDFAVALNPSLSLALRDSQGISNFENMLARLGQLSTRFTAGAGDQFSLFINGEEPALNLSSYESFFSSLTDYPANMRQMTPSLESLTAAVNMLSAQQPGRDRILIYQTGYIGQDDWTRFAELLALAAENRVSVYVWMVMDAAVLGSGYFEDMRLQVEATGGSLAPLTGREDVPDPADYLAGKGYTITASYQSQARSSGSQSLVIEVSTPTSGLVRSDSTTFDLQIEPPSLSFINLPAQLTLTFSEKDQLLTASPQELAIEVQIAFPDNRPRELAQASLWVNGVMVQKNSQPPYGSFLVDLAEYRYSQELTLQARLTDELGLEGRTELTTIPLTVTDLVKPSGSWLASPWLWIGAAAVLLAAGVVFLLPVLKKQRASAGGENLPNPSAPELPADCLANLARLGPDNQPAAEKPLQICHEVTLIGSDPELSDLTLNDPSIEAVQAQLRVNPDGSARLTDFNSKSGTFINFEPVTPRGAELHHADIVQFGRLTFRFSLNRHYRVGQPVKSTSSANGKPPAASGGH